MKLETQVVSLDLAKRLKELNVKQESYAFWNARPNDPPVVLAGYELGAFNSLNTPKRSRIASAFTVAELSDLLRKPIHRKEQFNEIYNFTIQQHQNNWLVFYQTINGFRSLDNESGMMQSHSLADACAMMLIYLLENKLI